MSTDFYSAVNYTIGSWTVKSQVTDTKVAAPKDITIPDLDYSNDYVKKSNTGREAIYANVTSDSLVSPEKLRVQITNLTDIYANSDIPSAYRTDAKGGVKTYVEVETRLIASNTAGETVIVPLKGSVTLSVPSASFITADALSYVMGRALAATFSTGGDDVSREVEIARGALEY